MQCYHNLTTKNPLIVTATIPSKPMENIPTKTTREEAQRTEPASSPSSSPSSSLPPFRLLDLPAEVWSEIVLLTMHQIPHNYLNQRGESAQTPPIARVCRAIRQEVLPFWYQHKVSFWVREKMGEAELRRLTVWLRLIGREGRALLPGTRMLSFRKDLRFMFGPLTIEEVCGVLWRGMDFQVSGPLPSASAYLPWVRMIEFL
jgi:hypothetical protein